MPRSTASSAIYRPDLGISVLEYAEGPTMGLIGTIVMPVFPVNKQSSSYPVVPKEALLKLPETARSPRSNYNRGDWEWERGIFSTVEHGWEEPVDDTERELLDLEAPGAADLVAALRGSNIIKKGQEKRIADTIFNASNFTAHAVTDEWDDVANATPIDDVKTGKLSFRSACGMLPDALIIAYSTFENLKNCEQIVNRLKYTFPGIDLNRMTSAQLAAVFDVPQVLIGGAVYDSAKKGASASISDIWSNEYAALVKIAKRGQFAEPGVGFTFLWTEDSAENPVVEQYREESRRSDVFRVRHNTDECLMQSKNTSGTVVSNIASACVYLFSNITT